MNSPAPAGFLRVPAGTRAVCSKPSVISAPGASGSFGVKIQRPELFSHFWCRGCALRSLVAASASQVLPSNVNFTPSKVLSGVMAMRRIGLSVVFRSP